MMPRINRLAAGLALAGSFNLAHAAGFALIEQNASGLGNAYAGQAASAQDASTIFFNPAGMTMLPDRQLVAAGHLIVPQAEFTASAPPTITIPGVNNGGNGGDAGGLAFVPNAYYAMRLGNGLHFGVGMNAPFGLATEYDRTWVGSTHAVKSELKTINLNPSLAWKVSDAMSLGAGVSVQYAEATLTNALANGAIAKVKGDDYSFGVNVGALWKLSGGTRIGLAYRSEVDYTLEGDFTSSDSPTANSVTADATMPDSASLSVFHRIDNRWDLLADVTWTGWSDFEELRILTLAGTTLTVTPENWSDSWRYSVGVNYHYSDVLTFRAGVAYDETPVSDAFRTARIPDESRTWLALGARYQLSPKAALDVGYAHLFVEDARVGETRTVQTGPATFVPVTLTGNYDASVDILSAQLTLNF
ncbi:MAG: outer membrane protein transport protein [Thiobacillus sp.]